ncbi:hypothetical protein HQ535_12645 [bacterium]|nr:hypothetical protein [bacterium]
MSTTPVIPSPKAQPLRKFAKTLLAFVVAIAGIATVLVIAFLIGLSTSGFGCSGGAIGEGCSAPHQGVGYLIGIGIGIVGIALVIRMASRIIRPRSAHRGYDEIACRPRPTPKRHPIASTAIHPPQMEQSPAIHTLAVGWPLAYRLEPQAESVPSGRFLTGHTVEIAGRLEEWVLLQDGETGEKGWVEARLLPTPKGTQQRSNPPR